MTSTTKTKTCKACGKTLPVSQFHACHDCADGFRSKCIECERARNRETYQARKIGKPIARVMPTRYDHARMLELARKGYTSLHIAEILGCNRTTVYKALRRYDIDVSARQNPRKVDRSKMRALLEFGRSQTEVAKILGCSVSVVSRYVAEANNIKSHRVTKCKGNRAGMTCAMNCAKYPCFDGIDKMSSNLAKTCVNFSKRGR